MTPEEEVQLLLQYFNEIKNDSSSCCRLIQTITSRIENGELDMDYGNDFLNVRNQLLLGYLSNLTTLIKEKCRGKKLELNPVVDVLIQLRVYIEKSQKIYKKMNYQIEKILSFGKNISDKSNNPLVFKPAPYNLLDEDEDGGSDEDEINQSASTSTGTRKSKKSNVYIPPKVAAIYDDDESAELAKQKAIEKAKKRALSSKIIQELRAEYDEGPEEIRSGSSRKKRIEKKLNEIKDFEEENFLRVNLSKKEKKILKRPAAVGQNLVDEVTNFGDTSFLTSETRQSKTTKNKSSKRKSKITKKKFKKFKK